MADWDHHETIRENCLVKVNGFFDLPKTNKKIWEANIWTRHSNIISLHRDATEKGFNWTCSYYPEGLLVRHHHIKTELACATTFDSGRWVCYVCNEKVPMGLIFIFRTRHLGALTDE